MASNVESRKNRLLSRREIEKLIANGAHIIIFDNRVLKVDAWLPFHPGGPLIIKHMVGRDATDEVNALHSRKATQRMYTYQIGRIQGPWENLQPPIHGGIDPPWSNLTTESSDPALEAHGDKEQIVRVAKALPAVQDATAQISSSESRPIWLDARTEQEISRDSAAYPSIDIDCQEEIRQKYRALDDRLRSEGLYECNYWAYGAEVCWWMLLLSLAYFFNRIGWYGTSGACVGLFWWQSIFTSHDASHAAITHNTHVDTMIGLLVGNFMGGFSMGWWKGNHNVHHIMTNHLEHDPDTTQMPFLAISHRYFASLKSTYYDRIMKFDAAARFLLRFQHYLYYPLMTLGRMDLYYLSIRHFLLGQAPKKGPAWWHRWIDLGGILFFWTWFGYGVLWCSIPDWTNRALFIVASHVFYAPLHVQFTLSHYGMSTADLGMQESFPQRMIRTTQDFECPEWLDFIHGGIQFQIVHHLFPRIPRHNLRRAKKLVMEFCRDADLPYTVFSFVDTNKRVIGTLSDVAKQVRMYEECRKSEFQSWNTIQSDSAALK